MLDQQPMLASAATVIVYSRPSDLVTVRQLVRDAALAAGLSEDDVWALQTAVNELASNTLRHTDEGGVVSIWATADEVRVTVADNGHIGTAAQVRAADDPLARRGLLLVGALCDQVSIRSHRDGTTVHIVVPRH